MSGDLSIRVAGEAAFDALLACDPLACAHRSRREQLRGWLATAAVRVAMLGGRVVGFIVVDRSFFDHAFIRLICVAPDARRRGIALRLVDAAIASCATPKLFASTNASNAAARAMFERAGFVRSGAIENLDDDDDELIYLRTVAPGAADRRVAEDDFAVRSTP